MGDYETDEDWAGDVNPAYQHFAYNEPEPVEIPSGGSDEGETPEYDENAYWEENGWEGDGGEGYCGEDYEGNGFYGNEPVATMPSPSAPPEQHQQPSMHNAGISARTWETLNAQGYCVLSTLGQGSFATVMRARAANLGGREVAIKDILKNCPPGASPEQVASQQQYLEQFLPRELSIIKNLKHEHIIGFYTVLETSNHIFVAMELAANGTVEGLVNDKFESQGHGVSEYVAGYWFWQTLMGLQYCHERGIAHRDLKPENLLLNNQFHIKIIDFGFAKTNITKGEVSRTYCGSMSWACIEILKNIPYDPRLADVWSMGLILYFMVYGFNPFRTDSLANLVADASQPVQFPLEPSVHHSFQDIIHDCMVVSQLQRKYVEELFRFDPYIIHIKTEIETRNPSSRLEIPMVSAKNSLVRIDALTCPSPVHVKSAQRFSSSVKEKRVTPPMPCDNEPPPGSGHQRPKSSKSRQHRDGPNSSKAGGHHDSVCGSKSSSRRSRDKESSHASRGSKSHRKRSSRTDSHGRVSSRQGSHVR